MTSSPYQNISPSILALVGGSEAPVSAMMQMASLGAPSSVKPRQVISTPSIAQVAGYYHAAQNQANAHFAAAALPPNQLALMASQGVVPSSVLSSSQGHLASPFHLGMPAPLVHLSHSSSARILGARKQRPVKKAQATRKHMFASHPYATPKQAVSVPVSDSEASPAASPTAVRDERKPATRKRASRMCKIDGCPNTVVQGGVCISHGAKRKQCKTPGCTKSVKKAGLCSAHGPSRKKCEHENCVNTAVQGGLCISHGARKRLCGVQGCERKAKASWNQMCKRHFDNPPSPPGNAVHCTVIGTEGRI